MRYVIKENGKPKIYFHSGKLPENIEVMAVAPSNAMPGDEEALIIKEGKATFDHIKYEKIQNDKKLALNNIAAQREAAFICRVSEIESIKKDLQEIADSDKPAWEKKLLARLVKDLR